MVQNDVEVAVHGEEGDEQRQLVAPFVDDPEDREHHLKWAPNLDTAADRKWAAISIRPGSWRAGRRSGWR